jgi:hypothetical protein
MSCAKTEWRQKNKKKVAEIQARARKKYNRSLKGRFTYTVNEAKRRKLVCTLSFEEYAHLLVSPCYYCGLSLDDTSVGLDRIDNSLGYTLSNVLPCCGSCNRIRGDSLTVDEMSVAMQAIMIFREEGSIPIEGRAENEEDDE